MDFNIFAFEQNVGKELTLSAISHYLFQSLNLFETTLTYKNFESFLQKVKLGYLDNPYHNSLHAADVLQTCSVFFKKGSILEGLELNQLDQSVFIISALLHDISHPGLSNSYQINTMSKLALKYNDKSVLENYHCYEGFKILNDPASNILESLSQEEFRIFRKRMIECIIATDMSNHSKVYSVTKFRVDSSDFNGLGTGIQRLKLMIKSEDKVSK